MLFAHRLILSILTRYCSVTSILDSSNNPLALQLKRNTNLPLQIIREILIYIFDTSEENRGKELSSLLMRLDQIHTRKKYISVEDLEEEVRQNVLDLLKRRFKEAAKQVISTEPG
jgi:hypothetical protein